MYPSCPSSSTYRHRRHHRQQKHSSRQAQFFLMRALWAQLLLLLVIINTVSSQASYSLSSSSSFLWISDIHLDPYYGSENATSSKCGTSNNNNNNRYGQFGCDSPISLVESALHEAVNVSKSKKIEFAIITGDLCRHETDNLIHPIQETRQILYNVSSLLVNAFGNGGNDTTSTNIIVSIGNNDVTPDYYMDDSTTGIDNTQLQMLSEGLGPLLRTAEEKSSFAKGGYYARNVTSKLTVLSLNTVIYSSNHIPRYNSGNDNDDPFGQFHWLEQQLQIAKASNRSVYIIGHIPPVLGSYRHSQLWQDRYVQQYYTILQKEGEDYMSSQGVIRGQFFGHIHSDEFRIPSPSHGTYDSQDNGDNSDDDIPGEVNTTQKKKDDGMVIWMASSITPIYGSNPSIRIAHYESDTGMLLDYDTYYMDLLKEQQQQQQQQQHTPVIWQKSLSFKDSFQIQNMSRTSIEGELIANLKSDRKSIYWNVLMERQHVYQNKSGDGKNHDTCENRICQKEWLCTFISVTKIQFYECMSRTYYTKTIFGFVGILLLAVFVVLVMINFGCGSLNPKRCCKRRAYQRPMDVAEAEFVPYGHDEEEEEDNGNTTNTNGSSTRRNYQQQPAKQEWQEIEKPASMTMIPEIT